MHANVHHLLHSNVRLWYLRQHFPIPAHTHIKHNSIIRTKAKYSDRDRDKNMRGKKKTEVELTVTEGDN